MGNLIKNAIQCKLCGDIIESESRHDYVQCRCGNCAVDGGLEYQRIVCKSRDSFINLAVAETEQQD